MIRFNHGHIRDDCVLNRSIWTDPYSKKEVVHIIYIYFTNVKSDSKLVWACPVLTVRYHSHSELLTLSKRSSRNIWVMGPRVGDRAVTNGR